MLDKEAFWDKLTDRQKDYILGAAVGATGGAGLGGLLGGWKGAGWGALAGGAGVPGAMMGYDYLTRPEQEIKKKEMDQPIKAYTKEEAAALDKNKALAEEEKLLNKMEPVIDQQARKALKEIWLDPSEEENLDVPAEGIITSWKWLNDWGGSNPELNYEDYIPLGPGSGIPVSPALPEALQKIKETDPALFEEFSPYPYFDIRNRIQRTMVPGKATGVTKLERLLDLRSGIKELYRRRLRDVDENNIPYAPRVRKFVELMEAAKRADRKGFKDTAFYKAVGEDIKDPIGDVTANEELLRKWSRLLGQSPAIADPLTPLGGQPTSYVDKNNKIVNKVNEALSDVPQPMKKANLFLTALALLGIGGYGGYKLNKEKEKQDKEETYNELVSLEEI